MSVIYLVHCVDTEGPLYESIDATAERLEKAFGISVSPSPTMLEDVRAGIGVPPEILPQVNAFLSRMAYNKDWGMIDEMLDDMLSEDWRNKHVDDFGGGYTFNWFVMDHVGFDSNPRRRSLGYHGIYDYYRSRCDVSNSNSRDRIYWHFHPVSYFKEANKTSCSFNYTSEHIQVLSRRVIDYMDFPVAYRPGSHTERPDINLFLEQWIPFDYGNQGMEEREEDKVQMDITNGRFGDWRFAPDEWGIYHPDFFDYQKRGSMKRYIARCLNLDSRLRPINRNEIDRAFQMASVGNGPVIMSVTNHDEREMRTGIDWYMKTVRDVQKTSYKDIKIKHCTAVEAIRGAVGFEFQEPVKLDFSWEGNRLHINPNGVIWGPQPFLCFRTKDKQYIHENLDRYDCDSWSFTFDDDTIKLEQVDQIGVATHDNVGNTSVYRLIKKNHKFDVEERYLNCQDWIS